MAWTYIDSATGGAADATTATIDVSLLTIAADDLIVVCINRNASTTAISLGGGAGGTWIEEDQADGAQTNRWSIQYKKATASEPTSYTFALNSTQDYNAVLLQLRSGTGDFELDQASNINEPGTDGTHTALGVTTTGVAVAVAFVVNDASGGTWSAVGSPFASLVQSTGFRIAAGAHRLMPSGGATGNADFTASGSRVYSGMMLSFKEAAAASSIIPQAHHHYRNNLG